MVFQQGLRCRPRGCHACEWVSQGIPARQHLLVVECDEACAGGHVVAESDRVDVPALCGDGDPDRPSATRWVAGRPSAASARGRDASKMTSAVRAS